MARVLLNWFATAGLGLVLTASGLRAGESALAKELQELNALTGSKLPFVMVETIIENKDHARKLVAFAVPAAENKELSYNGALTLGLVAGELKDTKRAELYLRVCMDQAAKRQSAAMLKQSYGLLIKSFYDAREYAKAASICRELMELDTNDGKDRLVIGTTADNFGGVDFGEPQEGFSVTQSLRADAFANLVRATAKQGLYDSALKLVDSLPKNTGWSDHELRGWVLVEAGRLQDAARGYEDVIEQLARDKRLQQQQKDAYLAHFRQLLSSTYVDLKEIDKATEVLQTLIKSKPNEPGYYNDLGYIWADHNLKLDEAEKLVEKALELDRAQRKQRKPPAAADRDNGNYLDSLGWVYYRQQKFTQAKELLLRALEDKNAQSLDTFDHLGDVCLALGETAAAVKAWQQGLEHVNDTRRDRERKVLVEKKLGKVNSSK